MKFRRVDKPKTGYLRMNGNPGPLRWITGKHEGRPVPTKPRTVREVVCARCTLPSYPGLPPLVKALGFDRKTAEAIAQYVHVRCPGHVEENWAIINKSRAFAARRTIEKSVLPKPKLRAWESFRGLFRR